MSLEYQNSIKIAELTRRFNEIIQNSKKIEDLELLEDLDVSRKMPVGDGKAISIDQILNQALSNSQNGVTEIDGSITVDQDTLELTIPAVYWRYGGVEYSKQTSSVFQNEYAEEGKFRIDLYYGTTNNEVIRIVGIEGSGAVEPVLPLNTVRITTVLVSENEIGAPTPPVFGDLYVQKEQFKYTKFEGQGTINNLPLKGNCITEVFSSSTPTPPAPVAQINGFSFSTGNINSVYDGQDFYIKNGQTTDILIKHNVGTLKALLYENLDQVLKPGQVIYFKYISNIGKLVQIVIKSKEHLEVNSGNLQNIENTLNMLFRFIQGKGLVLSAESASVDYNIFSVLRNNLLQMYLTDTGKFYVNQITSAGIINAQGDLRWGSGVSFILDFVQFLNSSGGNVRNAVLKSSAYTASGGGGMLQAQFLSTDANTLNEPLRFTVKSELNVALADALAAYNAALNAGSAANTANNNAFNAQTTANNAFSNAANADAKAVAAQITANNAVRILRKNTTVSPPVTGTVALTLISSFTIPANTFNSSDFLRMPILEVIRNGSATNGAVTLRVHMNTLDDFTNSFVAATLTLSATNFVNSMSRNYKIRNNLIAFFPPNASANTDISTTVSILSERPFSVAQPLFVYISLQLANSSDSASVSSQYFTN